jgi:ACS family tartrate transporter-like MFS transporter
LTPAAANHLSVSREIVGKAKRRLVWLIVAMYFIAYLDRVNIGFAALTMNQDLGFSPAVYGFGAGVFFWGYFLFEVPSNILLVRFGANRWLARIMFTWGLASMAMALTRGSMSFYALRFLLGFAEAGLAPGLVYYMTIWFPSDQRAKVFSLYFLGNPLATIIAAPASGWILDHLEGAGGLKGWQWLFLIEGLPAVLFAFVVWRYLTNSPEEAEWLTPQERTAYVDMLRKERVAVEAAQGGHASLKQALKSGRVWVLSLAYLCSIMGLWSLAFWLPLMVKEFNISNTHVGVVVAIPYAIGAVWMILFCAHSDATQERRWHFVVTTAMVSAGFVIAALSGSPLISMIGLTLSVMGSLTAVPMFFNFPAALLTGPALAGSIALINSIGNLSGSIGPWLIGEAKQVTGNNAGGQLVLAGCCALAPLLVFSLGLSSRPARHQYGDRL